MNILVRENNNGHCFGISNLKVLNNLTFCDINGDPQLYPILMKLVKANVIYSFEPKNDVTRVAFYTEHVEEIF
jgi:hypothetical protein